MEAICSSETSVAFQQTTRRHIPEDDTLHWCNCYEFLRGVAVTRETFIYKGPIEQDETEKLNIVPYLHPYHERDSIPQSRCPNGLLSPKARQTFSVTQHDRLCGLVVRVSGYRSGGPGFYSRRFHIVWEAAGLKRGPLSLLRTTEELLEGQLAAQV
jgi:hypothetical protein